jgi:hypothetical protein
VLERIFKVYRENLHEDNPLVFTLDCQKTLISAIQEVCPQINWFLCIWYVQKVVAASCRSSFQGRIELDHTLSLETVKGQVETVWHEFEAYFNAVIYAYTEEEYQANWDHLQAKYNPQYPGIVDYLENIWFRPYKRRIVRCWTKKVFYLDNNATS